MSGAPGHWKKAKLGDLLLGIEAGKSLSGLGRPARDGEWGVIKVSAMTWGRFDTSQNKALPPQTVVDPRWVIKAGDLLFSRANTVDYVGACVVVDRDPKNLIMSDKSLRLLPVSGVSSKWLRYALGSPTVRDQFTLLATGTSDSMRNISQGKLKEVELHLPPLDEQRRIVEAIEEQFSRLDAACHSLWVTAHKGGIQQDHLVRAALTGQLNSAASAQSSAPWVAATSGLEAIVPEGSLLRRDLLPEVPSHWTWSTLSKLAALSGGVTKDSKKQSGLNMVEVPYLRVANVQRGHLDLSVITTIRVTPEKAASLRLVAGDVLFNEGGDRDKLGRGWVWREELPNCIHQNHVFRARIKNAVLLPEFMSCWGNVFGQTWFEANGRQTTNLASISLTVLGQLPVPVPPVEEQQAIVARIDEMTTLLNHSLGQVRHAQLQGKQLRQSLLAAAFSGRLTPAGDAPTISTTAGSAATLEAEGVPA
jgi:type I restriction enzyme S subunit